jgi:hypothetical protein
MNYSAKETITGKTLEEAKNEVRLNHYSMNIVGGHSVVSYVQEAVIIDGDTTYAVALESVFNFIDGDKGVYAPVAIMAYV